MKFCTKKINRLLKIIDCFPSLVTVHIRAFAKLGILCVPRSIGVLTGICEWPQMPAEMQSKKTFNLRKIVKNFSMNLKKTRRKFERAMETIIEENLKDGESES